MNKISEKEEAELYCLSLKKVCNTIYYPIIGNHYLLHLL